MDEFNATRADAEEADGVSRREQAKLLLTSKMDYLLDLLAWADSRRAPVHELLESTAGATGSLSQQIGSYEQACADARSVIEQFLQFIAETAAARHRNDAVSNQIRKQLRRYRDILEF